MSKYDEFDLDIQNTHTGNVTYGKTGYTIVWCKTTPVLDCAVEASRKYCPTDDCPQNTQVTCPSGNCHDGTLERCPARRY